MKKNIFMKSIKLLLSFALLIFLGSTLLAQTVTKEIKVWGNCESCKKRIEYNAKAKGVEKAVWDQSSQMLSLTYDSTKVKSDDIEKKIAMAGHDTQNLKADDNAYNKLPACCKYERKK
jgi:periplasmic mercuric ion binding protein